MKCDTRREAAVFETIQSAQAISLLYWQRPITNLIHGPKRELTSFNLNPVLVVIFSLEEKKMPSSFEVLLFCFGPSEHLDGVAGSFHAPSRRQGQLV
jgi:hypothetical protein